LTTFLKSLIRARTRGRLELFNWELFDHLPEIPDLAPYDYHLFTNFKN
jgi:hypothetical protein